MGKGNNATLLIVLAVGGAALFFWMQTRKAQTVATMNANADMAGIDTMMGVITSGVLEL